MPFLHDFSSSIIIIIIPVPIRAMLPALFHILYGPSYFILVLAGPKIIMLSYCLCLPKINKCKVVLFYAFTILFMLSTWLCFRVLSGTIWVAFWD